MAKPHHPKGVEVHLNLGGLKATPEQRKRIRESLRNHVLGLVQSELGAPGDTPVTSREEVPPLED